MLNYNMRSLAFSPISEQNPIEAYGNMLHSDGFISVSGINRRKICRSRMTRHDIHVRSALYVSIDTKRKVLDVVKKIGSEYMTATSYVENIVRQHLELYKDDINRIYKQKSTKNLI